ncbi:MAG TPA: methionyl-tRNA formyltransferase [Acidimicrobiales bacterium]
MTTLAFLGTPESAVPALRALVAAGHDVTLVVSRADRRRGRGGGFSPSPVKAAAIELGIAVTDRLAALVEAGVELGVVVAYGRIIPVSVLERVPMVNVHFSLLPRWRGAAPVERALLAGDRTTGVCIMEVEEGLDTGGVYARREVAIGARESADQLRGRLATLGAELLVATLEPVRDQGVAGLGTPQPQQGDPTYAAKIDVAELVLRWERPADELDRLVRVGRAHSTFRGQRLGVLEAEPRPVEPGEAADAGRRGPPSGGPREPGTLVGTAVVTGSGNLELLRVQPAGGRAMAASDWLRGVRPVPGERLGGG